MVASSKMEDRHSIRVGGYTKGRIDLGLNIDVDGRPKEEGGNQRGGVGISLGLASEKGISYTRSLPRSVPEQPFN